MSNSKSLLDLFLESAVGFDYLDKYLGSDAMKKASAFLPYNITTTKKGYAIEMAVAGYKSGDISVEAKGGSLSIKGKKPEKEEGSDEFLYRGLGLRSFQKYFSVVTGVEVKRATIKDGILRIELEKEVISSTKIPVGEG